MRRLSPPPSHIPDFSVSALWFSLYSLSEKQSYLFNPNLSLSPYNFLSVDRLNSGTLFYPFSLFGFFYAFWVFTIIPFHVDFWGFQVVPCFFFCFCRLQSGFFFFCFWVCISSRFFFQLRKPMILFVFGDLSRDNQTLLNLKFPLSHLSFFGGFFLGFTYRLILSLFLLYWWFVLFGFLFFQKISFLVFLCGVWFLQLFHQFLSSSFSQFSKESHVLVIAFVLGIPIKMVIVVSALNFYLFLLFCLHLHEMFVGFYFSP